MGFREIFRRYVSVPFKPFYIHMSPRDSQINRGHRPVKIESTTRPCNFGTFFTFFNSALVRNSVFFPNTTLLPRTNFLPGNIRAEQRRFRADFVPKRRKYKKAHKGRVPVRTGGSTKGNYLAFGDYGIRVKFGIRLTSAQLTACHHAIKRKIKPIRGAKMWMRVFPDIPVTSKGNECRMGKGKGSVEYWACRVPMNKIVFEIGGGGMRKEVAKEVMKLVADKLPGKTEFVDGSLPGSRKPPLLPVGANDQVTASSLKSLAEKKLNPSVTPPIV